MRVWIDGSSGARLRLPNTQDLDSREYWFNHLRLSLPRMEKTMMFFRHLRRFLRPHQASSEWTVVNRPDGSRVMLDRETVEYMQSQAPQPSQRSLDTMLEGAHGLRIIAGGASGGQPLGEKILLEIRDASTLADFRQHLRIVDGAAGHCMCHGDPTIELLDNSGKRAAVIGLHHGKAIRWNGWRDDAELVDGRGLLEWLAAHEVQYPLRKYLDSIQSRASAERAWQRWFAAMPPALRSLLTDQQDSIGMIIAVPSPSAATAEAETDQFAGPVTFDAERLLGVKHAIEEAYPDTVQRAEVLFEWYGKGNGAWTSFPAYEEIPEYLLIDVPFEQLLSALRGSSVPEPRLEGAARFFAGWTFAKKHSAKLTSIPPALRQQLLDQGLKTEEPDRRARAEIAFNR